MHPAHLPLLEDAMHGIREQEARRKLRQVTRGRRQATIHHAARWPGAPRNQGSVPVPAAKRNDSVTSVTLLDHHRVIRQFFTTA